MLSCIHPSPYVAIGTKDLVKRATENQTNSKFYFIGNSLEIEEIVLVLESSPEVPHSFHLKPLFSSQSPWRPRG